MRPKGVIIVLSVLTVSIVFYAMGRSRVNLYQADYTYRLHASALFLPSEIIKVLAGEFKGLAADYLLLEAASFIGSSESLDAGPEDWEAVTRLMDQSSTLDPYFRNTYRLAQATLPWYAKKYDETLTILERSREHLPWDWEPGFFIGFNYYFFLKDNLTASKKLMEAARISGAPITLSELASRLASRAGQTSAAIDFLIAIYDQTEDKEAKEILKQRIQALQGVLYLQAAVDRFNAQFGHVPQSLDELVGNSIIPALPPHPYNRSYSLSNGLVDF